MDTLLFFFHIYFHQWPSPFSAEWKQQFFLDIFHCKSILKSEQDEIQDFLSGSLLGSAHNPFLKPQWSLQWRKFQVSAFGIGVPVLAWLPCRTCGPLSPICAQLFWLFSLFRRLLSDLTSGTWESLLWRQQAGNAVGQRFANKSQCQRWVWLLCVRVG